jgi:GNAT acetyltransferase-like protein
MWLSGFDDAWARARVTMVTFAAVLRDAFASGLQRVSLGGGEQPYKLRFADDGDRLAWWSFPTPGPRLGLVLGEDAGRRGRRALRERLGPERRARVHALLDRLGADRGR